MPGQETFLDERAGGKHIVVLKTYDERFARDAFDRMPEDSLRILGASLELDQKYEADAIPAPDGDGFGDALWEEIKDDAREDWNLFSYFVVQEHNESGINPLYVSADWPSAEVFARNRLSTLAAR